MVLGQGFVSLGRLVSKTIPFDAGQKVELKFELSGSGVVLGGALYCILPAADAERFTCGDEIFVRVRPA